MTKKQAIERTQRCLDCPNPPCRSACPLSNRIPEFLSKVKEGEIDEAMRIILRENPLPGITGYVCPSFCQSSCVLAKNGSCVQVGEVEKFVSGNSSVELKFDARETGKRVAIIGSGPAGLAGGYFLRRAGHEAVIYEKSPVVGGMMVLGIPDFRLPRKILQREVGRIRDLGVKIRTDSPVEYIDELFEEGYDAVLSAIGSHKSRSLNIAGENLEGVRHAIPFLRRTNLGENITLGDKIAIIGGGDAAIDAARTVMRMGSQPVIIYRRSRREMPANREDMKEAEEEGVQIRFQIQPRKFLGENGRTNGMLCIRNEMKEPEGQGRRKPIPIKDSEFKIQVDEIIEAIGERPDRGWIEKNDIAVNERGLIDIDRDDDPFATSRKGVYAAGDAVLGPSTITESMKTSKIAANSIDNYLKN